MIRRRAVLGAAAAALAIPAIAQGRTRVRYAGGGVTIYGYMPFFVCMGRRLFEKHGIDPDISMFPGGSKAMQAVLGGSSDVACGFYEHTIQIAAKGGHLTAFVLQTQNSNLALGARKEFATLADLKGRRIGVSAPGSATHMFAMQLFAKAGMKPTDFAAIGVGTTQTAMSAFERGEIDALSLFDPIVVDLEQRGLMNVLADARTTAGTQAIFGGPYAAGSLYAESGWLAKNEAACRLSAAAILEAVEFLRTATPEQAIGALEKGMCFVGQEICTGAFVRNRDSFRHDGRITPAMAGTVKAMLASFNPEIAAANVDLGATYTNRFVGA